MSGDLGRFSVPADHPCLPGHFPGAPLVPGVLLLQAAIDLLLARHPGRRLAGLPSVRFLAPVLPGQSVRVAGTPGNGGRIQLEGRVEATPVFRAQAELA